MASWNLPLELNPRNTKVKFEVDSTWHLTHFKVKEVKGNIWLSDQNDYRSIKAEISFPVNSFDSKNDTRDNKMLRVMNEEQYKNVTFKLDKIEQLCNPLEVQISKKCEVLINGSLTIRETEKKIIIPATVGYQNNQFLISGKFQIDWSQYGVEDPSILVAKVYKNVLINFTLAL